MLLKVNFWISTVQIISVFKRLKLEYWYDFYCENVNFSSFVIIILWLLLTVLILLDWVCMLWGKFSSLISISDSRVFTDMQRTISIKYWWDWTWCLYLEISTNYIKWWKGRYWWCFGNKLCIYFHLKN